MSKVSSVDTARLSELFVLPTATLRDAIERIDSGGAQIALVVGDDKRLIGTISDGDVRRALLEGADLGEGIERVIHPHPVVADRTANADQLLQLMIEHGVEQVPLVDGERVVDLALLRDFVQSTLRDHSVVVVAGGEGRRLRPLTEDVPKPMLDIGGRPLLETTLLQIRDAGFSKVYVLVNYRSEVIENYFGDGGNVGLDIRYVREPERFGSAGALRLVQDELDRPFVVVNGDLLTKVNLNSLLRYHLLERNLVTVGVRQHMIEVPYGVVELEGTRVREFKEKPSMSFYVNAGVYALDPAAVDFLPDEQPEVGMDELIHGALAAGAPVGSFAIHEYWLDVGHIADYERAHRDHATYFRPR